MNFQLRSGSGNCDDFWQMQKQQEEFQKNTVTLLTVFTKHALRNAATYVEHAERKVITSHDIKMALMQECFDFGTREGTTEEVEATKEELFGEESDEEEEDVEEPEEPEEAEEYRVSRCTCIVCQKLNTIEPMFSTWDPPNIMLQVLKRQIQKMP